jgi:hypothetical protein
MLAPSDRIWLRVVAVAAIVAGSGIVALGAVRSPPLHAPARSSARARRVQYHVVMPPAISAAPVANTPSPATEVVDGGRTVTLSQVGLPSQVIDPSDVATVLVPTLPLYASPGAASPEGTMANPNYLGAKLVLLVTAFQGGWIQAYIPERPNEFTAWVPLSDVAISTVPCHIAIGIGAHKLVLYCNNAPVFEAPVATGAPGSPTPTGSFYVAYIVKLTDPGGPYGPYALGTSAFSNTYYSFEGGPGQVGIHGTDQPWVIGSYASHGCVRLNNNDITTLAQQVEPGTPVEISS